MNYLQGLANEVRMALGPDVSKLPDDSDDLLMLYALLARVKGRRTTREDVHDAWATWKSLRGEDHPSLVRFGELLPETQMEDEPFVRAILAVSSRRAQS